MWWAFQTCVHDKAFVKLYLHFRGHVGIGCSEVTYHFQVFRLHHLSSLVWIVITEADELVLVSWALVALSHLMRRRICGRLYQVHCNLLWFLRDLLFKLLSIWEVHVPRVTSLQNFPYFFFSFHSFVQLCWDLLRELVIDHNLKFVSFGRVLASLLIALTLQWQRNPIVVIHTTLILT